MQGVNEERNKMLVIELDWKVKRRNFPVLIYIYSNTI